MPLVAKVAAGLGMLWLLGWLALPLLLKPQLEHQASQALGRTVTVDAVSFKPWSLELEVLGLRVGFADAPTPGTTEKSEKNGPRRLTDMTSQLSIQRIYVDAELSSVLHRAPVVDAVQIDHPVLHLRHTGQGQHDLQDVLDRLAKPSDPPEPDTGPVRLAIHNIQLLNGQLDLHHAPEDARHTVTDITLTVPFISTLNLAKEVRVSPKLAFKLNGSPFETEAQIQPFNDSMATTATVKISGLNLTPYLDHLPKDLAVSPVQAILGADLKVEFAQTPHTQVRVTGHLSADNLALNDARQRPLLTLGSARVELADVRPLERVALLGLVELNEPHAHLSRNAQGLLNTEQDASTGIAKKSIKKSAEAQKSIKNKPNIGQDTDGWTLGVAQLKVSGGGVEWADALTPDANQQPARLALSQLQVNAQQLHWPLPTEAAQAVAFDAAAQLGSGAASKAVPKGTQAAKAKTPAKTAAKAPDKAPAPAAEKARVTLAAATKPAAPASLSLKGTVLASQADATVGLNDLALSVLAPYLSAHVTPSVQGQLSLNVQANWKPAGTAPGSGTAKPDDLTLTLNQLSLTQLKLVADNGTEAVSMQALEVRDAQLRPLEHTANLGKVSITRPVLPVQRNQQGQLMFDQWLKVAPVAVQGSDPVATNPPPSSQPASATPPAPTWAWQLPELSVTDGQFGWRDELPAQPVVLQTSAFKLLVKGLASRGGAPATVTASMRVAAGQTEPGTLGWQGTVWLGDDGQTPHIKGQLDARRLPAHALAPYTADQLNLNLLRADTSFNGSVAFSAGAAGPTVQLAGNATLEDFRAHTTNTTAEGNELLHWKTLNLKGLNVALAPSTATQVSVQSGALSDFFARIVIQADGRINLQNISKQAAADAPVAAKAAPASASGTPSATATPVVAATPAVTDPLATRISIGPFSLVNGAVDFSDKFIRPNYHANLSDLTGRLGGFSSDGAVATTGDTQTPQMADLELRGKAEGTASLEIVGKLNPLAKPLALDIEGRVRDLELPPLSPYTIKYTGHGIERGKLSLDVAYAVLPNGQLTARNQLVLNQLTFGDAVPGAPASLPVKLAVALLADRQGVIDLDLPISGSLNDPEFSLVPIVFKIIGNIIVKAITSPFALLTGALGGDSNELSQVAFVPGTTQLEPASADKLARVAKALTDKPNLKLTVVGTASLEAERTAYQRTRLQTLVRAEQARNQPATEPATGADHTRWLAAVYKRTDMPKPRNAIGMAKDIAPEDMEALLLAQIPATESQMQELAVQRGVAVRDHLARLKVPTQRVFLGAPTTQPKAEPVSSDIHKSVEDTKKTTSGKSGTWQPVAELKLTM